MDFINNLSEQDKPDPSMSIGSETLPSAASSKWIAFALGVLIAIAGFMFHWSLELRLEKLEVLNQYSVFFESDPNDVLSTFACWGLDNVVYRRGFIHANLGTFFGVPIKAFGKTFSIISHGKVDRSNLQRQLGLLVVPISAALFYLVFHRLLLQLGFSLSLASLFTLLAFVSFSQMIFGSIPETFAISNLAIALTFLLFVIDRGRRGIRSFLTWTAVGVFATGITITNIVPVIILFWLRENYKRSSFIVSIAKSLGIAALILALTVTLNAITFFATDVTHGTLKQEASAASEYKTRNVYLISKKFLTFPALLINSIIAPMPKTQPDEYTIKEYPKSRYLFRFTFDLDEWQEEPSTKPFSPRNLAGIALFLLLLLPIRSFANSDRSLFLLSWGALLIIGFNWSLHSIWGTDRFLYSQHWYFSLMFLLAALIATQLSSRLSTVLVAASVILVAANNLAVVRSILMVLRAS
jgi:hypothetical protein